MCNRFRNERFGWRDWLEDFSQLKIPLRFPEPLPNIRGELRPTDESVIIRPIDSAAPTDAMEAAVVRWDLLPHFWRQPVKAKKFLCTNARSETVHTTRAFKDAHARRRCLVPADGFFEWTGQKGGKTKWMITATDQPWFCFAGLWDRAETADGPIESFTILTSAAGADMQSIHHRQPVILPREGWADWLNTSSDATPLYEPGPAGTLQIELAPAEAA